MALFLGLYLGHVLGDFVFQPGRLVVAKRQHQSAVLLHSAIVAACTALSLLAALDRTWIAVLVAGIAHIGVEQLSIRARGDSEASNLTVFLLDQALHVVAMAMIAAVAYENLASPVMGLWSVSLRTLAATCGVVTVAFAGSIFVFELQAALDSRAQGADRILSLDGARIYGFLERAGALIAALALPVPALGILVFAPRILYALSSPADRRRRQLIAAAGGSLLCAAAWALVVLIGPGQ